MNKTIFCPSNHLILNQPACPVCGWKRPPHIPQGGLLWSPKYFPAGIGGPSQDSFSRPGVVSGAAVFAIRSGELVGISQADGAILWKSKPAPDLFPRQLYPDGDAVIGVISDNRTLDAAGNGFIVRINLETGAQEKVWEGYGYTMAEPAMTDAWLITRTARPRLVALRRGAKLEVAWEAPLKTYKPISPVIAGDLVLAWDGEVTREQATLKAFDLHNGKPVWQAEISDIDCSPVAVGGTLIYRTGKKQLTAVNLKNGEQIWRRKLSRIYSRPAADGKRLFAMLSDDPDVTAPGHYSLQCIDVETGEPVWTAPLGIRAQEVLPQPDGTLLVGMGDPVLAICSAQDGRLLWKHSFGEEKINRVQTHLAVEDGIGWVGTYEGKVCAVRVAESEQEIADPETCLRQGDLEAAAAAYALGGDFLKAAELFIDKLDQPKKALAIYEQAGNVPGQAKALLHMGDELSAANLLAKDGKPLLAAPLFEQANELRTAMLLYQQAGRQDDVERLRRLIPLEFSDIELLEKEGRWVEAGDGAMKLKDFQKAYTLYERAGEDQREKALEALLHLVEVNPEPWSLEKLSETARSLGNFPAQARAFEMMNETLQAAEAFLLAGMQAEKRTPGNRALIAEFYEQAYRYFKLEGEYEKQHQCRDKVMRCRAIPSIFVSGETDKAFREGEFNTLILTIENIGYGRADDIKVWVPGDRFEIEQHSMPEPIEHLAKGLRRVISLPIRPLKDQVGEGVPFVLEWEWRDKNGKSYHEKTSVPVTVKQQGDSKSGGTPITIVAENYYAGNDQHLEIDGDNIQPGAQKGGKVEINHGERARVFDAEYGELTAGGKGRVCPNCDLPVEEDADFCGACGENLTQHLK